MLFEITIILRLDFFPSEATRNFHFFFLCGIQKKQQANGADVTNVGR